MPLSEEEQRILRQIEEQLQRDHNFGREMLPPRRRGAGMSLWLSGALTVVMSASSILLLAVHPLLSFAAFVGSIGAGIVAEARLREYGDERLGQFSDAARSRFRGVPSRDRDD